MSTTTTLDTKGRILIPKTLREALGLKKGSTLKLVRIPSGIQVSIPKEETRTVKEVYGLKFKRTGKPEWASAKEIKSIWKDTE